MLHKVWFEEGWSLPFVHVNIVFVVIIVVMVVIVVISVAFPCCTKDGLFILTFCYCFLVSFVVIIVIEYNKRKVYLWDLVLHKIRFEEGWSFPFVHVNIVIVVIIVVIVIIVVVIIVIDVIVYVNNDIENNKHEVQETEYWEAPSIATVSFHSCILRLLDGSFSKFLIH